MGKKGLGFLVGLVVAGVPGLVAVLEVRAGCEPSDGGCELHGGLWSFLAVFASVWLLPFFGPAFVRDDDWRPSLGVSSGALAAIAVALCGGPVPVRVGVLIAMLAAVAVGTPLVLWYRGRRASVRRGRPGPAPKTL